MLQVNNDLTLGTKAKSAVAHGDSPTQIGDSTTDSQLLQNPQNIEKEKEDMSLEELIREYERNKSGPKSIGSDSSSCFVSSSDEDQTPFGFDENSKKNFIQLYRREHGGIVIYDVDGNIPGQPAPEYPDSDLEDDNQNDNSTSKKECVYKPCDNSPEGRLNNKEPMKAACSTVPNKCLLPFTKRCCKTVVIDQDIEDEDNSCSKTVNLLSLHLKLDDNLRKARSKSVANHSSKLQLLDDNITDLENTGFKRKEKVYGINEIAPDYNLLNKRPNFSKLFQKEIMAKITRKRRYDNPRHRFKLRIPPEEEMKVRFESRFENANLK